MFCVGVSYLLFESQLVAAAPWTNKTAQESSTSRTLLGIQTGLILLAMLVTKSSIESLQARRGLPLGNQILGWVTLRMSHIIILSHSMSVETNGRARSIISCFAFPTCSCTE
jgi:GPI ethanolamine phosphate transferase 1